METIQKFKKYNDNLSLVTRDGFGFIRSYQTDVARIDGCILIVLGYWSKTTTKHINYAAKELGLTIVNKYRSLKK